MMQKTAWLLCLSLTLAAGCNPAPSEPPIVVSPTLFDYSEAFQDAAAKEMTAAPPCRRDRVEGGCSAVNRLVQDYGTVRDQIRAARP